MQQNGFDPSIYTDSVESEEAADATVLNKAHKKYQKCLVWQAFHDDIRKQFCFLFYFMDRGER
jgi:hypothetical protein